MRNRIKQHGIDAMNGKDAIKLIVDALGANEGATKWYARLLQGAALFPADDEPADARHVVTLLVSACAAQRPADAVEAARVYCELPLQRAAVNSPLVGIRGADIGDLPFAPGDKARFTRYEQAAGNLLVDTIRDASPYDSMSDADGWLFVDCDLARPAVLVFMPTVAGMVSVRYAKDDAAIYETPRVITQQHIPVAALRHIARAFAPATVAGGE